MADIVDKKTRSRMMSRIRCKNSQIEMTIRKHLWAKGFRYRLHEAKLPGKPDIVFPGRHAVIFINGCFWHGHNCSLFRSPKTRTEFWRRKIFLNQLNEEKVFKLLSENSWRILIVWECALRGKSREDINRLIEKIVDWLTGSVPQLEISGKQN